MVMETPHLVHGPDQGGPDQSVTGLGLGQPLQQAPEQSGGGAVQPQPDKGYDFGDVLLNFVFRGYPMALEKLDLQKKDKKLAQELREMETKRKQARSNVNRAQVALQGGRLEHAAELMGKAYEAFPDGLTYSGIRPGRSGQKMVWFKDKTTGEERAVFPLNEETVKYAINEANAGLRGDNFMKEQVAALAQIKATNNEFLREAEYDPETKTYFWWHVDRNGDYTVKRAPKAKFPGIKKRYDDTDDILNKLKKDYWEAHAGIEGERLKQIRDPRQSELVDLTLEKERLGLKKAERGLGGYIQVGDTQMTTKEIDAEMKVLKTALSPVKGDKPLMLVSDILEADDSELKTELDRWQRLAKEAKTPQSRRAAKRYLQLFYAVTKTRGEGPEQTQDEDPRALLNSLLSR